MKTVVIVHHTGVWGGGTKSLIDLCDMLRDKYKIIVCIPSGYPDFCKKIIEHGCKVYELSTKVPFFNIYSGRSPIISMVTLKSLISLRLIKQFGKEILDLKPDIVVFNTLVIAVSSLYLSRFTKVLCIDRETLSTKISKLIYKQLLDKHLDAITFLADYEKRKLRFTKTISLVFPDCVKLDSLIEADQEAIRKEEGISCDKYVILFMGGLAKIKGTDIMLQAMDSLDNRFQMIFAGEIDDSKLSKKQLIHDIKYPSLYIFKKKVIKYYNKLKGTEKLHETGLRNSIDKLIVASDIVVFPATSVHQPRPCIEAGAYGKPVVISDYKETSEFFKNGYNAITFKPGKADELANSIMYAYEHPDEMKTLGKNNRKMTEKMHNFYDCKEVICSLIEKVCSNAN